MNSIKKLEDGDSPDPKRDVKPQGKTLNRVPSKFSFSLTFAFCLPSTLMHWFKGLA